MIRYVPDKSEFNDRWAFLYGECAVCARCNRLMPIGKLNAEAIHHHGANQLECINRDDCRRATRNTV